MDKNRTYKIAVLVFLLLILSICYWMSKNALFVNPPGKSKVEALNSNNLNKASGALNNRNFSINFEKIEINNYDFGNVNPFQEKNVIEE